MNKHSPYVSEQHEGQVWFEWCVTALVVVAAIVAFLGYLLAATVIISATACIVGVLRMVMRENSPWKVRSVGFDAFFSIALGIGLIATYLSITLIG